jgi:hypothetical protein
MPNRSNRKKDQKIPRRAEEILVGWAPFRPLAEIAFMFRYFLFLLTLAFLMESSVRLWAQDSGSVLGQQVWDAIQHSRPKGRAATAARLTVLALAAEQDDEMETWAWAEAAAVAACMDAQKDDAGEVVNLSFEPGQTLAGIVDRCEKQGVVAPLSFVLQVQARYFFEQNRPVAAAQTWERAGTYALDARQVNQAVDYWIYAARTYQDGNQAAHVRECQSWLDLLVQERSSELSIGSRALIEGFRKRAETLLAQTFPNLTGAAAALNFQPFESSVVVSKAEHERGRARFVLSNHQTKAVEGLLTLTATQGNVVEWVQKGAQLQIKLRPSLTPKAAQHRLRLRPGEQVKIFVDYLFTAQSANFTDLLQLDWTDGQASQVAVGKFTSSGQTVPLAQVTNWSVANQANGWPVPFYHEIFYRGQELSKENVLVKVSAPARVEIYNEDTGELLAIDAEGDGIYTGENDFLAQQNDHDGDDRPDLVVDAKNPVGSLEIYVFPRSPAASGTKVSVQMADYTDTPHWRVDAVDQQHAP